MTTDARIATDPTSRFGSAAPAAVEDARVVAALEEYLRIREASHAPNPSEFVAGFPEIADTLREALAGLVFLEGAAPSIESSSAVVGRLTDDGLDTGEPLGDFRLIREIGRGGMGVVYEARQRSLGRRVAVKILPFAATLDRRQLARFQNEARAAAVLDHPNIVPVYYIGCDRGVHHYAMQFIEGHSLAEIVTVLAREVRGRRSEFRDESVDSSQLLVAEKNLAIDYAQSDIRHQKPEIDTAAIGALTTAYSDTPHRYFRRVAELGAQAAEALAYAHDHGIVHRDIKPANLLLDVSGKLWVTDFGLAHIESPGSLTMTGDVIGTLRYMSPEQAAAKPALVDHRTDIYSLGVTLYELVALRPAFTGNNREDLLRRTASEMPPPLSLPGRRVPADLDTIIRKAIAKDPLERYATGADLAADLTRFLDSRAILARRDSPLEATRKWTRRHAGLVLAATGVCLLLAIVLATAAALIWREKLTTASTLVREREQRTLAEENVELGLVALSDICLRFFEHHLPRKQEMEPADYELLRTVGHLYEQYLIRNEDRPATALQVGIGYCRLASAASELGDYGTTERALERARDVLMRSNQRSPEDVDVRFTLVGALVNSSSLYFSLQQPDKAERFVEEAVTHVRELYRLDKENVKFQYAYCCALSKQCVIEILDERQTLSPTEVQSAVAIAQRIPVVHDGMTLWDKNFGGTYCNLVRYLADAGRNDESAEFYAHGLQMAERLQLDEEVTALMAHYYADFLAQRGQPSEAASLLAQALEIRKNVATVRPNDVDNLDRLIAINASFGELMDDVGRGPEAQLYRDEAARLSDEWNRRTNVEAYPVESVPPNISLPDE